MPAFPPKKGYDKDSYKNGPFAGRCSSLYRRRLFYSLLGFLRIEGGNLIGQRLGEARVVHLVEAKAHEMLRDIGTEGGHRLWINVVPFAHQLVQSMRQKRDIRKNDDIGQQMIVLEILTHLAPVVGRDHTAVAKRQPLGETIERFALVGFSLDNGPQLRVSQILQQETSADHAPKLAKRLVQFVFVAIGC